MYVTVLTNVFTLVRTSSMDDPMPSASPVTRHSGCGPSGRARTVPVQVDVCEHEQARVVRRIQDRRWNTVIWWEPTTAASQPGTIPETLTLATLTMSVAS